MRLMNEIHIEIDEIAKIIRLKNGSNVIKIARKWFQLFCVLIGLKPEEYLHRTELLKLHLWLKNNGADSAGAEVSRYIGTLQGKGFDIIESGHQEVTSSWRIRPEIHIAINSDVRATAAKFLALWRWDRTRKFANASTSTVSNWMKQNVEALLALTEGRPEHGKKLVADAFADTSDADLLAISTVLATRIGQRTMEFALPNLPVRKRPRTVFETAVHARRLAAQAIRSSANEWDNYLTDIKQLLPTINEHADTTTLAFLFNALAVLARRQGNIDEALANIKEAAPLALFSGDLTLIQGVLFNFGNILSETYRVDPSCCTRDDYIALLSLDVAIRKRHLIGLDSAQTEILLAFLHYELGDMESAKLLLVEALPIMQTSQQIQDQAFYNRVDGLIDLAELNLSDGQKEKGLSKLDRSIELYVKLGNTPSAQYVTRERNRLVTRSN